MKYHVTQLEMGDFFLSRSRLGSKGVCDFLDELSFLYYQNKTTFGHS